MKKKPVQLDTFDGHLVLLCKNHYDTGRDFFESVQRLWEVRCGVPQQSFDDDRVFEYVADRMFNIIRKCEPERMKHFHQQIHKELANGWFKPKDMSHIKAIVWEYRSIVSMFQVKEKTNKGWFVVLDLPKPQKQIVKRICRGNGRFEDYDKLVKKDTRELEAA